MKLRPRVAQFELAQTDAELDARIAIPARRVTLSGADPTAAAKRIGDALRAMFIPDRQAREILRHLVSLARAHAEHHFDTDDKYLAGLYSKSPWGTSRSAAICFTGQAGTGKSQILLALGRLLSMSGSFYVEGHSNLPLVAAWMMTLAKGDGLNQLLKEHVEPAIQKSRKVEEQSEGKDWKIPELLKTATRVSWRDATCLMPVDEFQWIAASSEANARASTVLLKLHSIGPLLLFCANFSLVRKLERRPPEDRDRLLSRPIILLPLAADDPDWTAYLTAARSVEPDVLKFDPAVDGKKIHGWTFGIKRKFVDLIEVAVKIARSRSADATVGGDELLAAYRSAAFAMHREDVEVLMRQDITGEVEREDLVCPFASTGTAATKIEAIPTAVEHFERRTEDAILADAMLPSEARAHQRLTSESSAKKGAGKVVRFARQKITKEGLLEGAAALDALGEI